MDCYLCINSIFCLILLIEFCLFCSISHYEYLHDFSIFTFSRSNHVLELLGLCSISYLPTLSERKPVPKYAAHSGSALTLQTLFYFCMLNFNYIKILLLWFFFLAISFCQHLSEDLSSKVVSSWLYFLYFLRDKFFHLLFDNLWLWDFCALSWLAYCLLLLVLHVLIFFPSA